MSPAASFFGNLDLVFHGLGISCIVGAIGYATDSQFTYGHIVEWIERLCKGDNDAIVATLLFLSIMSGSIFA